jgi:hypothetical protein
VGSDPGASRINVFSHFHHFTAQQLYQYSFNDIPLHTLMHIDPNTYFVISLKSVPTFSVVTLFEATAFPVTSHAQLGMVHIPTWK